MNDERVELNRKIVVTGGGSGGHVSTASSIITAIAKKYALNKNFLYIGSDLGMENEKPGNSLEMKVFEKEDFQKEYIRAGKLQRNFSLNSIRLLLRTILGFYDSIKIIRKFRPEIILSTGGFVTVPICLIGRIYKAKIYLHEQTAAVGLSNKIVSKVAEKIFITFPSSKSYFPEEKTVHTGNLVREDIFNKHPAGREIFLQNFKMMLEKQEQLPIIYISGGSLGSHIINITVKEALKQLLQNYQIVLQTGDNKTFKDYEVLQNEVAKLPEELRERVLVLKYVEKKEIGFLLNSIDLFVGRSGANTVYEMGVLKIPSILIPIPWVTHNEQYKNAKMLEECGLGTILNEGELTPANLSVKIRQVLESKRTYNEEVVRKTFPLGAEEKILRELDI